MTQSSGRRLSVNPEWCSDLFVEKDRDSSSRLFQSRYKTELIVSFPPFLAREEHAESAIGTIYQAIAPRVAVYVFTA